MRGAIFFRFAENHRLILRSVHATVFLFQTVESNLSIVCCLATKIGLRLNFECGATHVIFDLWLEDETHSLLSFAKKSRLLSVHSQSVSTTDSCFIKSRLVQLLYLICVSNGSRSHSHLFTCPQPYLLPAFWYTNARSLLANRQTFLRKIHLYPTGLPASPRRRPQFHWCHQSRPCPHRRWVHGTQSTVLDGFSCAFVFCWLRFYLINRSLPWTHRLAFGPLVRYVSNHVYHVVTLLPHPTSQ